MSEKTKYEMLREIHYAMINGQIKEMVRLIKNFNLYDVTTFDFFTDYKIFLEDRLGGNLLKESFDYYAKTVVAYFKIENR